MDSINISQAGNAVATMRALPWLATSSTAGLLEASTAVCVAAVSVPSADLGVSLPAVGAYRLGGNPISGVRTVITTDQATTLMWDACIDHKFSNRLGPSASPPV